MELERLPLLCLLPAEPMSRASVTALLTQTGRLDIRPQSPTRVHTGIHHCHQHHHFRNPLHHPSTRIRPTDCSGIASINREIPSFLTALTAIQDRSRLRGSQH